MKRAGRDLSFESLLRECAAAGAGTAGRIEADVQIETDLPGIAGNRSSLRRLLRDVCRVAVESMPAGGILSLRAYASTRGPSEPGVRVVVRDGGSGYDASAIARIRRESPRPPRAGAERTLAGARDTAIALGGTLYLVSARGCGTSVVLEFPAVQSKTTSPERPATPAEAPAVSAPRGRIISLPREAA